MGARSRHPWRSRFCPHSALRRFKDRQRLLVPPGSREKKIKFKFKFKFKFKGKSRSRNSWLCFCFCFCPCSRLGFDASAPAGNCHGRQGASARTVGAMGPRHASGGLGRTPNPGLAVCAGQRTRASGDRAYMGEGALLAKHCFASARTPSRQRLGRTAERGLRHVLAEAPCLPNPATTRRQTPQPRALLGFTRFPKKIALISNLSVPCQYLRCAGSSANSTTLPCPCAETSSHALPATLARLRSDR